MRIRTIVAFAAGAVAAIVCAAPPAFAASPAKKAIWGPLQDFPRYHDLGVGIYEMDLSWAAVAHGRPKNPTDPNDPAYEWASTSIGSAIRTAAKYHIRILIQVRETPAWENGGHADNYPPRNVNDFAAFVTAAARRYPSVHLWMIWGEPDRHGNWATIVPSSPTAKKLTPAQAAAPRLYARMLDASYGALKRASKKNIVIGGNTYTTGDIPTRMWDKYMRLPNGRPPRMDLYGHNPFCFRAPNLSNPPSPDGEIDFSDLHRLLQMVNSNFGTPHHQIKLFLSEWEIPTGPNTDFNFYTSLAVQAQWITDGWRIVRRSNWIYALGYIPFDDEPGLPAGLVYANGKPKPAYYAFKHG